jgi:cytochrome c biogenesis protein CcmG, thiol:disulfide interchange protein DsbE
MARRIWPIKGDTRDAAFSAPGSPWVQELDGPIGIKALLIDDPYSLDVKLDLRTGLIRATFAVAVLLAALVIAGCGGSNGGNPDSRLTLDQAKSPISGTSPQLAAIRAQANQLLDGGKDAFQARLDGLRGTPVVVNKWASWCGPCRFEFPWFQSLAQKRGGQIAFLGVNSNDSSASAETFLSELPLPYPSYSDPDLNIAQDLGGPPQFMPTTAFYDGSGKLVYTHPGQYQRESDLVADVNRYAAGG